MNYKLFAYNWMDSQLSSRDKMALDVIMNHFHVIYFTHDKNETNVRLNAEFLNNVIGKKYKHYIEYLENNNYIRFKENYSVGLKSRTYELIDKKILLDSKLTDNNIFQKKYTQFRNNYEEVKHEYQRATVNRHKEIYNSGRIDFSFKDFEKITKEMSEDQLTQAKWIFNQIKDKNVKVHAGEEGRIYHPISNMAKEMRDFVKFDGKSLIQFDITATYIQLLAVLVEQNFTNYSKETREFIYNARYRDFYNIYASAIGASRNEVKLTICKWFTSKRLDYSEAIKNFDNWMKENYTDVYNFYNSIKQKEGYRHEGQVMAYKLMQLESQIVFDIADSLAKMNLESVVIHDCIAIKSTDLNRAFRMILNLFYKNGIYQVKHKDVTIYTYKYASLGLGAIEADMNYSDDVNKWLNEKPFKDNVKEIEKEKEEEERIIRRIITSCLEIKEELRKINTFDFVEADDG